MAGAKHRAVCAAPFFAALAAVGCARGATVDAPSGSALQSDAEAARASGDAAPETADGSSKLPGAGGGPERMGDGSAAPTDDGAPPAECDLTGKWALKQFTDSIVNLGVDSKQRAVNYFYFDIVQRGTKFTIMDSLRCGIVVTGATTVTINDATLIALLEHDNSTGRRGTYTPGASADCALTLEETVNVMGCTTPYYRINRGVPLPTEPAAGSTPGTEDWDHDGYAGITLNSGGGPRYVAMRDWNSYAGTTAQFVADTFQVAVSWDSEESVLEPTNFIVRVPSHRDEAGDHHVVWKRIQTADAIPRASGLETCKAVQALLASAQ